MSKPKVKSEAVNAPVKVKLELPPEMVIAIVLSLNRSVKAMKREIGEDMIPLYSQQRLWESYEQLAKHVDGKLMNAEGGSIRWTTTILTTNVALAK